MRRTILAVLSVIILLSNFNAKAAEVETSAVSAVLMEASTGRVLYEKNAHELRLIASITKLMTALVAVESHPDLSEVVTVKREWLAGAEGSSIYLQVGDKLTLEELLYGMLLESGNDAAQVVACYCAGDQETFVEWMNQRARGMGMKNSLFANPSGLNAEEHYSTAYDMALCAIACMENETIAEIVGTKSISFGTRTFTNHNKLLYLYEGCVGMKTGYTQLAGRTLVSCAERDGQRLIAVTLSAPQDWEDHMTMYEYGFSTYYKTELCIEDQLVRTIPVSGSLVRFVGVAPISTLTYPLMDDEIVRSEVVLPDIARAPVKAGNIAGRIDFFLNDEKIQSAYLVYAHSADYNLFAQKSLKERFLEFLRGEATVFYSRDMI